MKNVIYFFYFLKTTNYKDLTKYINDIHKETNEARIRILWDMIIVSLKYGASFKDYWMFKFYRMNRTQINTYVTTGRLYSFYTSLNDKRFVEVFRNKRKFNETFNKYIGREYQFLDGSNDEAIKEWLSKRKCIFAKPNYGVSGKGIQKINIDKFSNISDLISYLKRNKLNLIEDCIKQHHKMEQINSSSVNSIRIVTVLNKGKVDLLSAVLRIGVNNHVDNFSEGGIAAPVSFAGKVFKPAVTKIGSEVFYYHPVTGTKIIDFEIPFWKETVEMMTKVATIVPNVKTVGWDVAITEVGPIIIEGNDNWNKDAFQIPYGEGRQYILNRYLC